jgi:uncharacterized membrane-anchored protein YitT (DUF2179 family)
MGKRLVSGIFILLGVLSAGLGLKGFLLPSGFIDGGVTGISILIATLSGLSLPLLIAIINIPFIFLGYKQISAAFAIKSAIAILGLSLCLAFFPYPVAITDKLLSSVFGGVFLGAGIGLSVRGGGVLDGTEVMAVILSKKVGASVGDIILLLNVLIFSIAAFFLGIETALYSMLTYFSASKMIDFILNGIEEYNGIIIISPKSDEIKQSILNELGRGVTVYKGYGGMTEVEQNILFCVVTRLEIPGLRNIVNNIDETAFLVIHPISDTSGGIVKRRALH